MKRALVGLQLHKFTNVWSLTVSTSIKTMCTTSQEGLIEITIQNCFTRISVRQWLLKTHTMLTAFNRGSQNISIAKKYLKSSILQTKPEIKCSNYTKYISWFNRKLSLPREKCQGHHHSTSMMPLHALILSDKATSIEMTSLELWTEMASTQTNQRWLCYAPDSIGNYRARFLMASSWMKSWFKRVCSEKFSVWICSGRLKSQSKVNKVMLQWWEMLSDTNRFYIHNGNVELF